MAVRRIATLLVAGATAVMLAVPALPPLAAAVTDSPPAVTSFSQSAATVQVSGSNAVPVTFDVGLQGDVGGGWCYAGWYSYWNNIRVQLRRASDATVVEAPVVRVSGTDADGIVARVLVGRRVGRRDVDRHRCDRLLP